MTIAINVLSLRLRNKSSQRMEIEETCFGAFNF